MTIDDRTISIENLHQASDLNTALGMTIAKICQQTDWNYSEIWLPAFDGKILRVSPIWCFNTPDRDQIRCLEQFWECSKSFVLRPGEGLPGRVWSSGKPEWIVDVSAESETYFLRNKIAKAFGVKAGLGVPIVVERRMQMVLVFFMLEMRQSDRLLIERTQNAASQLEKVLPRFSFSPETRDVN